jgi:SRSO17 transposase
LLLPGERKSVEPLAARLAPENVRRMHQSLHHVVADAAWSDEAFLSCTRDYALAAMAKTGPVTAWIVDYTACLKKAPIQWALRDSIAGRLGSRTTARWPSVCR